MSFHLGHSFNAISRSAELSFYRTNSILKTKCLYLPRSGRERDGVTSTTSLSTWSTSPGTVRCRPAQLSPSADEAAGEWRTTLDIQTHRDRGGVPTARRQALEERALSGLLVRVKGLRIELKRECLDLRFVKPVRSAGKALSDMKIVKIQLV